MEPWHPLEHSIYRQLKALPLAGRPLLLAVSGGRDSMVLASVLYRLRSALRLDLRVCSIHHGESTEPALAAYRDRAVRHVQQWASDRGLPFLTNSKQPAVLPESEARLRKLRWTHLRQWQREQSGIVATGHHAQDFLETRLINLIRGTGPHGLHSMNLYDPDRLLVRPLLNVTAEEIASYSQALDVLFLNDPTNHDLSPLRNWLRHSWLPALDKKRPGSIQSFARSLDLMAQSQLFQEGAGLELDRRGFKRVADATKSLLVVELFRRNGVRSYTKAHVGEFLKRLDTTRKNFRFSVAGFEWIADAERVKRLSSESG